MTEPQDPPPLWDELLTVPTFVSVEIVREPRHPCVNCRHRRVLYRIGLIAGGGRDTTEARCRECWGMIR